MSQASVYRWRPTEETGTLSPTVRRLRRALLVVAYLLLAVLGSVWFARLVTWPVSLPRPHFIFLAGDDASSAERQSGIPVQPYVAQELAAWMALADAVRPKVDAPVKILTDWTSRTDLRRFAESFNRTATRPEDAVIVFVSAHGFVDEGVAYLHWNFGTGNPLAERIRFQELVAQLADGTAGTKLLILDAGGWPMGVDERLAFNEFPTVAAQELAQIHDPHLWVLMSHSPWEVSHVSPVLKRSLFGNFVTAGLAGAADWNEDGAVSIFELSQYVRQRVSDAVRQVTAGAETQTPQLFWLAGSHPHHPGRQLLLPATNPDQADDLARQPVLVSEASPANPATEAGKGNTPSGSGGAITAPSTPIRPIPGATGGTTGSPPTAATLAATPASPATAAVGVTPAASPSTPAAGSNTATAGSTATQPAPPAGAASPSAVSQAGGAGTNPAQGTKTANPTITLKAVSPASSGTGVDNTGLAMSPVVTMPAGGWTPDAAWSLRDQELNRNDGSLRLIDLAPQLWRTYESNLVEWEQSTDFRRDLAETPWPTLLQNQTADLADSITALRQRTPLTTAPRTAWGARLQAWVEPYQPPELPTTSIGLLRFARRELGASVSAELLASADRFETIISSGTPADLEQWLSQANGALLGCVEVDLARSLCSQSNLPWSTLQAAVQTRLLAERVAQVRLGLIPWFRERIAAADADRLAAERLLLDGVDPDRAARAELWLQESQANYTQIADDTQFLVEVVQLRNTQLYRALDLYRWWFLSAVRRSTSAATMDELTAMYATLSAMTQLLEERQPETLPQLQQLAHRLLQQQRQIDRRIRQLPVSSSEFGVEYDGGAAAADVLLGTSLPPATVRTVLWPAARALHRNQFAQILWRPLTANPELTAATVPATSIVQMIRLQMALAELIALEPPTTDPALRLLQESGQRLLGAAARDRATQSLTHEEFLQQAHEFRDALTRYAFTKAGRVATTIRTGQVQSARLELPSLVAAQRSLFVLHSSDLSEAVGPSLITAIQACFWHEHFVWLRSRVLDAQRDVPSIEQPTLMTNARLLDAAAQQIPNQAATPFAMSAPLSMTIPPTIALQMTSTATVSVQVENQSSETLPIWLVVDYDPGLLAIDLPPGIRWQRGPELRTAWMQAHGSRGGTTSDLPQEVTAPASFEETQWNIVAQTPPTLQLQAGQRTTLTLPIRRVAPSRQMSRLIVKGVTAKDTVRAEAQLLFPAPALAELVVTGRPNSWTTAAMGVELHPFPNLSTTYQIALQNRQPVPVDLELALLMPPPGVLLPAFPVSDALPQELVEDWCRQTLGQLPAVLTSTTVKLSAAGTFPVQLPMGSGTAGKTVSAAGAAGGGATAGMATTTPASSTNTPISLDGGVWLRLRDPQQNLVTLRALRVKPQHPRRYVQPRVRYDAERGRVWIDVVAASTDLLPVNPVSVAARFADPLPLDAEQRLSGLLSATGGTLTLFADLPRSPQPSLVWLDVNGYPRAFAFQIPRDSSRDEIPERHDLLAARITAPGPQSAFAATVPSIRVRCEWDVPLGALDAPGTQLQLGFDLNRDRILSSEPFVSCPSDRMVQAALTQMSAETGWSVQTTVTDYEVDLPVSGVGSGRWDLLAQMQAGTRRAWSGVVPVILDSDPPRLAAVALTPPEMIEIGKPLGVTVTADDRGLSGVATVELQLDVQRRGTWDAKAPAITAARMTDETWSATVPTANILPGTYSLLARATDALGNVSLPLPTKVRLLTTAEAAALIIPPTGRVAGSVFYGGQPQSEIEIVLQGPAMTPPLKQTTDATGSFQFPKVPAGQYTLTATGVVRNKRRKSEQPLEITDAAENRIVRIDLK